jgi:fatty-acyl-CoA synthase
MAASRTDPGASAAAAADAAARVSRTELTPLSFLRRSAVVHGDRLAAVAPGRRVTFAGLAERSARLAAALRRLGVEPGDRVATLMPNTLAMLDAQFGVAGAGAVLVGVNWRLSRNEVGAILADCRPRVLLLDEEFASTFEAFDLSGIQVVHVADRPDGDDPYERMLAEAPADEPFADVADEEDVLTINYTSGTTGGAKGVMGSHRGSYLQALAMAIEAGIGGESVFLQVVPTFHANGWAFPWACVAVGAAQVCLRKPDPAAAWAAIRAEGVTHANGAPTVYIALTNHPDAAPAAPPITVAIGGAAPSPTLLERMRALNLRPLHMYGLTETYAPIVASPRRPEWESLPADERSRLVARQGQANVNSDLIRVVDVDMRDVPRDGATTGEVVMRGNIVMKGYYGRPEATADAFRGGWFHSGDSAVWHPDGLIELRDRTKDIIISGGENISTIEVEQVIARHPAVLECAVVSMPDDYWGERPKAYVTLRDGAEASAEDIIAFCREELASFKRPAAVEFGELPKTATGKVQKYVLREQAWAGRERRIG